MEEQSKQPAVVAGNTFDEIEIEPIEGISDQLISNKKWNIETKDEVQWVVSIDAIASNEKKIDLVEEKTEKDAVSILEKPLAPIMQPPIEPDDIDSTEVNRLLAALDKLEELEKVRSDKPLPSSAEKVETKDASSIDVQQILEELKKLEEKEKTRQSKPLPSLPGLEKAKTEKAKASKAEEKESEVDVNQLLDELRKLEEQAKKELEKKPLKSTTAPLTTPVKSKQTSRLDSSEDAAIKRTLAEMSFIEGNESLAKGDRAGALNHYRDAYNYAPDNVQYILKLSSLLAEENSTRFEAEEVLTKGIEEASTNFELHSKLAELRGEKKGSNEPLNAAAVKVQELKTELKRGKTGKLSRIKFVAAEVLILPNRISLVNQAIIGVILGIAIWSIVVSIRTEPVKINLQLIIPPNETSVSLDKIEFEWKGAADKFLLQIEENGQKVLERTALETAYSLKPEDRALLKLDRRYTWRVAPCNMQGEPLPYIEDDSHFKTVK